MRHPQPWPSENPRTAAVWTPHRGRRRSRAPCVPMGRRWPRACWAAALTAGLIWGSDGAARVGVGLAALPAEGGELHRAAAGLAPGAGEAVGAAAGQNLFALDVAALEKAMLQHPWVRGGGGDAALPPRVSVEVVEHTPEALVVLGDLYVLDEEGEPFKRVTPGDGLDLPLVTGVERDAYVKDPDGGARADARGPGGDARVRGAQARPTRAAVRSAGGGHVPGAGDGDAGRRCGWAREIPRPSCRGWRACGAS